MAQGFTMIRALLQGLVLSVLCMAPVLAAPCGGDFGDFIAAISKEAAARGISRSVIDNAFAGVTKPPQAQMHR
jgi:membrane-bound lytic murein transglycosylase B